MSTSVSSVRVPACKRAGVARDHAVEDAARHLRHHHLRRVAVLEAEDGVLRHIDLHPQDIGARDREHRRAARGVGGDEIADIDLPRA